MHRILSALAAFLLVASQLKSGVAEPIAGPASQPLSQSAEANLVEDDAQDLSHSASLDLNQAESRLLAKIAESLSLEQSSVFFNIEENSAAEKPGFGVAEIPADGLYAELARRALAEDKDSRQALSLAILKGDKRAKQAKDRAYEDRLAESLIKRFENGDKGAKDELMKQALKGNARAREHLGLDQPAPVAIPEALSGTAASNEKPLIETSK